MANITSGSTRQIICFSKNKNITITELSAIVNISERKIKEYISKLKNNGLLERVGPNKGGYWEVIE